MTTRLAKEEVRAIQELQTLARRWPTTLWLFSANGTLCVMKKKGGQRAITRTGGMDQDYVVAKVEIENDGGDW